MSPKKMTELGSAPPFPAALPKVRPPPHSRARVFARSR